MAKKMKDFTIKIMAEEVMHTSISKSKGGYSSARVVVKKGDNEYMSINYEWEGDGVPGFAMDLMGFMQANEMTSGQTTAGMEEEYKAWSAKKAPLPKATMPGVCPNCGMAEDDCTCDGQKQLQKTKEKKNPENKTK